MRVNTTRARHHRLEPHLRHKLYQRTLATLIATWAACAQAGDPLTLTVNQGTNSDTLSFSSLGDLFATFNHTDQLQTKLAWYDDRIDSTAVLNDAGILFFFTTTNGGKDVRMDIPSTSFERSYTGGRDKSLKKLKKDIENNLSAIQRVLASDTPNSISAGSPSSLQTQLSNALFEIGFGSQASQIAAPADAATGTASSSSVNTAGLGLRFGRYSQGGNIVQNVTLPISYKWELDADDERDNVTVALPITAGQIETAKVFSVQGMVARGLPVSPAWSLTPAVAYGLTGSRDLYQASQQISVSLTSDYQIPLEHGRSIGIGNMVAYFTTLGLKVDGFELNPKISNTILRNGAVFTNPLDTELVWGEHLSLEASYIHTNYLGSALYITHTDEFGLTVGTDKNAKGLRRYLRAGLTYLTARSTHGFSANVGYWF